MGADEETETSVEAVEYVLLATSWRDASGVRHHRGDLVSPPESEIDRLIRARGITTRQAYEAAQAALVARQSPVLTESAVVVENDGMDGTTPPAIIEKPKNVAPKADWVEYAVARAVAAGKDPEATREQADAKTKQELIEALSS